MTKDTVLVNKDVLDPLQSLPVISLTTELTPIEKKNITYLIEKYGLTENAAIELLKNEEAYDVFKMSLKKGVELESIALQHTLLAKAKEKADAGFGETAQKLVTAAAILRD